MRNAIKFFIIFIVTGVLSTNAQLIVKNSGGTPLMTVTQTGEVGIGLTSPTEKLQVDGTVHMTGFRLGNSTTANYVLTASADGTGTWQPAQIGTDSQGLSVGPGTATTSIIDISNSTSDVTLAAGSNITLSEAGNTITIAATVPTVSGTTNYMAKFTGANSIGNSRMIDDGTNIYIGNPSSPRWGDLIISHEYSNYNVPITLRADIVGFYDDHFGSDWWSTYRGEVVGLPYGVAASFPRIEVDQSNHSIIKSIAAASFWNNGTNPYDMAILVSGRSAFNGKVGIGSSSPMEGILFVLGSEAMNTGPGSDHPYMIPPFKGSLITKGNLASNDDSEWWGIHCYQNAMEHNNNSGVRICIQGVLHDLTGSQWLAGGSLGYEKDQTDELNGIFGAINNAGTLPSGLIYTIAGKFWNGRSGNNDYSLHVTGAKAYFNCLVGINTTDPQGYNLAVNGNAAKPGGGSWASLSDARFKNIEGSYDYGLAAIEKLQPIRYTYKKDNPFSATSDVKHIGLVAQDVQKIIPEAVETTSDGILMINNDPIIFAMLNAIKELKKQNEALSKRIEKLER